MRKPAKAAPAPIIPTARRLEEIREASGFQSLRAFWGHVLDGWRDEHDHPVALSYEAVRTYHWNKPAPASYLARVASLFGYRLGWLVTGAGASKRESLETPHSLSEIEDVVDRFGLSKGNQALLAAAADRYRGGLRTREITPAIRAFTALNLLTFLDVPAKMWGFNHKMSSAAFNDFATAMIHALSLALPEPMTGDTVEDEGVMYAHDMSFQYFENRGELLAARIAKSEDRIQQFEAVRAAREKALAAIAPQWSGKTRAEIAQEVAEVQARFPFPSEVAE